MTFWLHTLAVAVVLLVFTAPAAADGKRLTTEKEFRELVVDRELAGEQTLLWYTGAGKMVGVSRGERVEGMWSCADEAGSGMCRTGRVHLRPHDDRADRTNPISERPGGTLPGQLLARDPGLPLDPRAGTDDIAPHAAGHVRSRNATVSMPRPIRRLQCSDDVRYNCLQ